MEASPDDSVVNGKGVRGNSFVWFPTLKANGGLHVESFYIVSDYSNFVEYGWDLYRPTTSYDSAETFNARMFDGAYAYTSLDDTISDYEHYFSMYRLEGDGKWHFRFDNTTYTQTRTSTWVSGRPWAGGEIFNQCDDGTSEWWGLEYKTAPSTWPDWWGTHWNCDLEKGYGYTEVSNTHILVDYRTDGFTDGCDAFS